MKKIIVVVVAAVLCVALIGTGCISNRLNLKRMSAVLVDTVSEYADGEIIEVRDTYGKLIGNGNGIQYFGAALLEKDAITDPDALLADLDAKFEVVGILDQKGNSVDVKYLEHQSLNYGSALEPGKEYVTVFYFNSWDENSNEFDLLGH